MAAETKAEGKPQRPTYAAEAIPSDIKQGVFLGNPILDNLVSCMIAMGTELWATKRRMKVIESVMASKGITTEMIEKYTPTEAEKIAWEKDRDRFVELTLGSLASEGTRGFTDDFANKPHG